MTGTYQHTLDAKGRLFVPARLREELGDVFYVVLAVGHRNVYSEERWNEVSEKVAQMPREKRELMRPIFAHAVRCELDGQGRILLPLLLREKGKLDKNVTVVGNVNYAEIWDSDAWNRIDADETSDENISRVYELVDF